MENGLQKKYGLPTAICMVIGIVIGSGVFFKAPVILTATGSLSTGVLAWIIGGAIMLFCAMCFAVMATRYERVNGIVDYAEAAVGRRYGYYVGWFLTAIYYPSLTGVLAYVSAVYTAMVFGAVREAVVLPLTIIYLVLSMVLNTCSPKLAGRVQVSSTIIKLIPLLAMAITGTIFGLITGNLGGNFSTRLPAELMTAAHGNPLLAGVVATSFAYEGWIIATSINAEVRNAKRNLPIALICGGLVIVLVYLFYFIGIAGGVSQLADLTDKSGVTKAYDAIFGSVAGTILNAFIAISCLGTLNGLTMGCTRGLYSVAARNEGPCPEQVAKINARTGMPILSCVVGGVLAMVVALYFYRFNFLMGDQASGIFFDISELPIVTIYAFYIPIFVGFMIRSKDFGVFRRFVLPILAICGSLFMVYAAVNKFSGNGLIPYLIFFAVMMLVGVLCTIRRNKNAK